MKFKVKKSPRKDKVFVAMFNDGKKVHFGQPGASVRPGTPKGDSYCARSAKIKGANNLRTPNGLSRFRWSCRGKKSISKKQFVR